MATLERRIADLEKQQIRCECSGGLVVRFAGDPKPESTYCPVHGDARLIEWPLPKSKLDVALDD
jgi:hypothetical protein